MQFKSFWEKVGVDVQRKDQQCYWSSFVCMAAIDKAEVPHFQRTFNKLQIATSTGRLISNWFFEINDLWPLVEADIESILLPVVLWENGSDGERMVRMRMRMVREWVGWWARSRRRSCRRSLSVNSCQPAWDEMRVNCSCEYLVNSQSSHVNRPEINCGSTAAVNTQSTLSQVVSTGLRSTAGQLQLWILNWVSSTDNWPK